MITMKKFQLSMEFGISVALAVMLFALFPGMHFTLEIYAF